MPSIKIDDRELQPPSQETIDDLAKGWTPEVVGDPGVTPTIEDIYAALRKTYTHDDLYQLDPEFILQHLLKAWNVPMEDLDPLFVEKIYGVLAVLLNPLEVTQDLSAFINTCLLANDQNTVTGDGELVPSRYIPRMIDAVNKMLPDDQDFHEVYWQDNIVKYIIECYLLENNNILDDELAYMDDILCERNRALPAAQKHKELVKSVRKWGQEFIAGLPAEALDPEKSLDDRLATIAVKLQDAIPTDLRDNEFFMTMLGKYIINTLYVKFYSDLKKVTAPQKS